MLSELAFSGRHAEQSVWVISQRYNSVLKDLREQTKWLCMFYTKDRDSFDNCLRENDVIPTLEERQRIKEELKKRNIKNLIYKNVNTKDGKKQIANMLYHAGVETLLTVGYAEIGKKVLRRPAPKVDFNMNDIFMLSIDILLAMATKDMLIKQGIIPADIMK
ncbi:unnamed protein product [Mytilus coruscus]|uniref:Uncharacterized protein n=1 Tax=Mytilus coruscus TaxID=42192 RepID=A0A6J8D5V3_MYTCO|nr:unnamed protein product [Mytilus coruscus]